MEQTVKMDCKAFQKNPDNTWTSIQITDVQYPVGSIRLTPGMTFKKGGRLYGVDVVAFLEENCAK